MRAHCRKVIDGVARDGGYILDASAIMQDDTSIENLRVMTEFVREYGVYSSSTRQNSIVAPCDVPASLRERTQLQGMAKTSEPRIKPGLCLPWEEKAKDLPKITGDKEMIRRVWEQLDGLGNTFIWQLLLSF